MSSWRRWLGARMRAARAFSLPVSVLPVVAATAAVLPPARWRWGVLLASAAGAAMLHVAGNLINDYYDYRFGVDRKVVGDEGRPGRVLVRGELTPADVLAETAACLTLAAALVAYLLWTCGPGLLYFAAAAIAAIYAYSGPPFKLKYRAMGEVVIFIVFGPLLMAGAAWAQTGLLEWRALLLSVPVGLATTAILAGNNVRDRREDGQAGIKTIAHVLGARPSAWVYAMLVFSSVLTLAGFAAAGLVPRVLLAAPLLLALMRKPLGCAMSGRRMPDIDASTARFETAVLVFLIVALTIQGR